MGILEKISEIEKEIARTQKNKGKHRIDIATCLNLHVCTYPILLSDIIALIYHLNKKKNKQTKNGECLQMYIRDKYICKI